MKLSAVLLLGVFLSAKAATVPPSVTDFNDVTSTHVLSTDLASTFINPTTPLEITHNNNLVTANNTPNATTPSHPLHPLHPLTQAPLTPSQNMCPEGWELFQGVCYFFVDGVMSWSQAQTSCILMDSMLASVHYIQEYSFLQQLTKRNVNLQAWLGGFYLQDQWLWIDGSWFPNNNNWSNKAPDSSNPCLTLNIFEGWSNSPCNVIGYSAICAKNSNVSPELICPQGWVGFQGRCFFYNTDELPWPEADTFCAGLDASLVSVHSPQEYHFLYGQTAKNGYPPVWLGGFYLDDQWLWLDGSWFYEGFFTLMSPEKDCKCLSSFRTVGWTNSPCDQDMASFCVKN